MKSTWAKKVSSDADVAAAIEDSGRAGESALGVEEWSHVELVVNEKTAELLDAHRPAFVGALRSSGRLVIASDAPDGAAAWKDRRTIS
jgi:hypothetical protein